MREGWASTQCLGSVKGVGSLRSAQKLPVAKAHGCDTLWEGEIVNARIPPMQRGILSVSTTASPLESQFIPAVTASPTRSTSRALSFHGQAAFRLSYVSLRQPLRLSSSSITNTGPAALPPAETARREVPKQLALSSSFRHSRASQLSSLRQAVSTTYAQCPPGAQALQLYQSPLHHLLHCGPQVHDEPTA